MFTLKTSPTMNTLKPDRNILESEAEDHAVETRYAVTHKGKELHPDPKAKKSQSRSRKEEDKPWQID
jgi:hypothetical protein